MLEQLAGRIRRELALRLPRRLALWLGIRRVTPGDRRPSRSFGIAPLDTGGTYRAKLRMQDPAQDPEEPQGGEGSSTGSDHGWSNCTMSSGATAAAYEGDHELKPWGGDMRHAQGDLSGGTDLYDLRAAWAAFGLELKVKSGDGWAGMVDAHEAGRAIVAQGIGNVPGAASFDGGHACVIAPESRAGGDEWLFGDPLCSDWQWIAKSRIREWVEAWDSSASFAVGSKRPEPPDPEPAPPEPSPQPPAAPTYGDGYAAGVVDGRNLEADRTFASWNPGGRVELPAGWATWDGAWWAPAARWAPPARWSTGWPVPLAAVYRARTPATWGGAGWTAAVWR